MSTLRKRPRRDWAVVLLLVAVAIVVGVYVSGKRPAPAPPAATPPLPTTPAPGPPAAWLGLNYNSESNTGSPRDFAMRGIVYDREGELEARTGITPENAPEFRSGLASSYGAGMVPVIQVDPVIGPPGCQTNPIPRKICLPTGASEIASYVQGFVQTASSVLRDYPGRNRVLFEPTDEPWNWAYPPGTPSGRLAAQEYAALLAQLLPAATAAKIPLSDIYVPATGMLNDGTSWVRDLYQAQPCLKPGPGSCGPIAGWYLHPYGLPHSATEGIDSVPRVRADMLSGRDNLVVSEIGFCANNVNNGQACNENRADITSTSNQAAGWLRETLLDAAGMHQAGWLRALLIWERSGTGWAMQNADGTLTAQGRVLDLFADPPAHR